MKTFDMTQLAQAHGFTGHIRVSERVIDDCMYASQAVLDHFGIVATSRLVHLLQEAVDQLIQYPEGTQAVRLTHYRVPPDGDVHAPLALELEAIVVQDDPQHGDYLLLAQRDELNHAELLRSVA